MDDVHVAAVVVGQGELVHVAVGRVSAVDPQGGHVALLLLRLPDGFGHEPPVPGAGDEDDVAAATEVAQVPGLLWQRVGAELDLERGVSPILHPYLVLGGVLYHLGRPRHFHPDGLRLD